MATTSLFNDWYAVWGPFIWVGIGLLVIAMLPQHPISSTEQKASDVEPAFQAKSRKWKLQT